MVDDRVGLQLFRRCRGHVACYDTEAFAKSDDPYIKIWLDRHPKKAKREETHWGAEVDGIAGFVGALRHKLSGLAILLCAFATVGTCLCLLFPAPSTCGFKSSPQTAIA